MISLKPPHFGTAEDDYSESTTDTGSNNSDEDVFDEQAFDAALQRQLGMKSFLLYFFCVHSKKNAIGSLFDNRKTTKFTRF